MKKYLLILLGLFLFSCNNPISPYNDGDYVYFTQPGKNKIDTIFGQISMGVLNEPLLWDENTFYYRIKYKDNNDQYKIEWLKQTSIIKKK